MTSNGEPFHFLPTAANVLFYKGSPSMKKVIMTIQPDLLQSALALGGECGKLMYSEKL